ncbi:inorganic phosphate transporter [Galbibacter pacificus]|uniref:Phosphate transporter n=1 Tax=Galbibacter pacificus TaxID=2996052 RepID=A0ABT6FST1_9FLAO|nr:inorganic phosphate transporter [Galbibacter pacificus]MDG3582560.1 inorganic phosphate transporter [Galbibacter pacificus]MDG3586321.1 inorganic phosphate transporter [Galbibacter pacificus]
MEQFYIFMLVALFALAITDLVVGVSNDAVNFLNSAVGSKAASLKTILIIASIGVAVGAIFSSGLMEVARKGIFNPGQFYFNEIMVIFMAVMITDILLLDLFNSLALPTSTTVSIVFELLGASVAISFIKIINSNGALGEISNYINGAKAGEIVVGILLSVIIAFTVGAIVQWISRFVFSFHYQKRIKYVGAVFGGVAITSIVYFILIKGIKSVAAIPQSFLSFVDGNKPLIVIACLIFFTAISQAIISYTKYNLLRAIILIGTFALALAFAGNDLVNFIGVPIAAYQSYEIWHGAYQSTGVLPNELVMSGLSGKVETPTYLLILAGLVMVVTLWLSKKARSVMYTEINLARSSEGAEKFEPNFLSRIIVRASVNINGAIATVLPNSIQDKIDLRFSTDDKKAVKHHNDEPAFDMVRASVNLMVASILISLATSLKLPLSTTYVSFMVAMGTSLSDKAWGRESAVYRVAGVFNVIGGWFVTAIVAFVAAALFATLIYFGKGIALVLLLILAVLLLARSFMVYKKTEKEKEASQKIDRTSLITINEIISESSDNISKVIKRINKVYTEVVDSLGLQDLNKLKKLKKQLSKLENEVDTLKSDIFYFIKSLDERSVEASKFYILTLDYLQDMVQSIGYISKNSYAHVNNNHKNLKFNQIRDLKKIDDKLHVLYERIKDDFDGDTFEDIADIIDEKKELLEYVSGLIQKQIERIRSTETSPKNTKLYFSILLETKDLITATINLLSLFKEFHSDFKRLR